MIDLLICPKCGQELEKNSRYCLNCGYCLSLEDNETNYTPVDNKTNICAVIGFVLSLVGGFLWLSLALSYLQLA